MKLERLSARAQPLGVGRALLPREGEPCRRAKCRAGRRASPTIAKPRQTPSGGWGAARRAARTSVGVQASPFAAGRASPLRTACLNAVVESHAVVTIEEIEAARKRLRGAIHETPCAYSETLSELTRTRCWVKLENLQMTGSFKERGAANRLLRLSADERRHGVAAASAGNHGLAVAFHAARLGIPAVIVMPEWAPLIKVTSARHHRAEVILAGADYDEAYERACAV